MFRRTVLIAALTAAVALPPALAATAAPTEPLDVTREFYKALHAGNASAAARLATGDGVEPALRSFVQISRAYQSLESALAKKFGADAAAEVGYGRKVQDEIKSLLGATAEVDGPTARIAAMDGRTITTLRNVNGAWRVELEDVLETPEGRAAFAAQARASQAAAKQVTAGIKAGKYKTPRAAMDDFEARVGKAAGQVPRPTEPQPVVPGVPQLPEGGVQL